MKVTAYHKEIISNIDPSFEMNHFNPANRILSTVEKPFLCKDNNKEKRHDFVNSWLSTFES